MQLKNDPLAKWMMGKGVPVTRESYIDLAYGSAVPEWDPELEAQLPEELQDWSLFKEVNGQMVYQEPKPRAGD